MSSLAHDLSPVRRCAPDPAKRQHTQAHGDTYQAPGELQAARTAWRVALAILDDLQDPDAADLRAKLESAEAAHTVTSAAGAGLNHVRLTPG